MKLADRVAIVTGAGSGIGRAIAQTFAREGAVVVVVDFNTEFGQDTRDEIVQKGGTALFLAGDVSDKDQVREMVRRSIEEFGRIDILVNNAGVIKESPFLAVEEEDWDRMMRVNLKGVFLCSQAAAHHMVSRKYGKIINISSRAYMGAIHQSAYVASKGGVVSLTRAMAMELAPHGINVNSIAPGAVETPLLRNIDPKRLEKALAAQPMGKFGNPQEIAAFVLFLATDEAAFITGQTIVVDGGRCLGGLIA